MLTVPDMQVIPEVVTKITEKATLIVSYNGKTISNGELLTPSETQVLLPHASQQASASSIVAQMEHVAERRATHTLS